MTARALRAARIPFHQSLLSLTRMVTIIMIPLKKTAIAGKAEAVLPLLQAAQLIRAARLSQFLAEQVLGTEL